VIILGIDPGTATTGYGVIKRISSIKEECISYGVISTSKEKPMGERLVEIKDDMEELIEKYKPDMVGIEDLFFFRNITTAVSVSQARGVVLECVYRHKIPCLEFPPLQIKQAVTGFGNAKKKQVQESVKLWLKLKEIPRPDDAADGLAVALTASRMARKGCVVNYTKPPIKT